MDDFGSRTGFVGSMLEDHEGLLVLRGDLPDDAARRVEEHVRSLLTGGARFVRVDARGARGVDGSVLRVLAAAQSRLAARRGLLSLTGLPTTSMAGAAA